MELISGSYSIDPFQVVSEGRADIGMATGDRVLIQFAEKRDIKAFGTVFNQSTACFMAMKGKVDSLNNFKGKKIGVYSNLFKESLTESYQSKQIDNYIDLTDFIEEYDEGKPENLKKWISYFLRVDTKSLTGQNLASVIALLKYYIQPLHELGDSDIRKLTAFGYPKPLDKNKSKVLPHKTEIILL